MSPPVDMGVDCKYELSCQLRGHTSDVRGICILDNSTIATTSRDKTVRLWKKDGERLYLLEKTLCGHENFVGPIAYISSTSELVHGCLVSGGMDKKIIIWNLENYQAVTTLEGHELQVTGIAIDGNDILSCSVDGTIRRWSGNKQLQVMKGHTGPVQSIIRLVSGEFVTGSSDNTIKIWSKEKCMKTIQGHTDTVRGLAVMPDVGFLSASHDGSVKLWSATGEQLLEMVGHTAIVYSVAAHLSGDLASGSEDGSAKIWRDGVCFQSIEHPGCVWDLKFLPNGDLVTACSDGVIRIWTLEASRYAPVAEREAYETFVGEWKLERKTVGGVKLSDLPGPESLSLPGNPNQTKIIREGDTAMAYSWNATLDKWEKIGEVVEGPDQKGLGGKGYDYEFDVEIEPGQPTRKLGYNTGENVYDVADKWLLDQNLPSAYRQQIVEFILRNTGQNFSASFSTEYVDPYTGANAYVPKQWTSGSQPTTKKEILKHIPKVGMLLFDTAPFEGILKKISEFNANLTAVQDKEAHACTGEELSRLEAIINILKDSSHYHSTTFAQRDFELMNTILISWSPSNLFPVIDMLRMLVLHPQAANHFASLAERGSDMLMPVIRRAVSQPVLMANLLTSIRATVNCFRHSCLKKWLVDNRNELLDLFSEGCCAENKNVRLYYITLILNYTVLLLERKDREGEPQLLSAAMEMSGPDEQDIEVQFRALQAIGSLIHSGSMKKVAIDLDIGFIVDTASKSSTSKVAEVAADIKSLIR